MNDTIKYFQIKTCPVCSKSLKTYFDGKLRKYYCQDFYYRVGSIGEWSGFNYDKHVGKIREPHYSVVFEGSNFYQSTIVVPFWIKTVGGTNRTRIYKFPPTRNLSWHSPDPEQDLIMEIPAIVPSDYTPEDFASKIKKLVIFL